MPYSITIEHLDELRANFVKAPQEVAAELEKATKDAGSRILETEKNEVPVKTATLKRSITMEYHPIAVSIYPTVEYALYVHEGTRPHVILPKAGKVLCFKIGGQTIFARSVNHPGSKANPFVERTVEKADGPVNDLFNRALDNIINFLAK